MKEIFGAKPPKRHGENSKLIFHQDKLDRLSKLYELDTDVKVGTHEILVGLNKHISDASNNKDLSNNDKINIFLYNSNPFIVGILISSSNAP
jgi:hypothetical protein